MFRSSFLSTSLILAVASSASALTITLADIGPRVHSSNPSLKAARIIVEEARGRQLGSGRLSNPTLSMDWRTESKVEPGSALLAFEQAFPITRRLSLEKKLTSQIITTSELEVRDAERRMIATAQSLAVQLLALDKQRALRQQQIALATKLSDYAKGRAKAGEISVLDVAQIGLDAQRLTVDSQRIEALHTSLLGELKTMLDLPPADSLTLSGDLSAISLPAITNVLNQRADYQLAQTKMAAAQTDADLAKAKRLQDVTLGFIGGPEQQYVQGTGEQRTGFIGFRISLPLPFWNRNQGEIAEKTAVKKRVALERDALGKRIINEADTARGEMLINARLAKETKDTLLPLALQQTAQLEKAYESGQADLMTVLRAREQRLQLEASSLDALRDFHLARIRYEAAIGKHAPVVPAMSINH